MQDACFDVVVLSANEDPLYIDFWPSVSWAYRTMFGVEVHLGFLTNRSEDDPYVATLRKYGPVTLFRPVPEVPEANQAKMVRHVLASQQGSRVAYLNDVDLLPLSRDWVISKTSKRPKGHLLLVGAEVYEAKTPEQKAKSTVPASMMTAEGDVFKAYVNPQGLPFQELVRSWVGAKRFSNQEDVAITVYHENSGCFSDEHMTRYLLSLNPVPVIHVDRGYDVFKDTLDRSNWQLDKGRLDRGEYLESHLCRPCSAHAGKLATLVDFIKSRYGDGQPNPVDTDVRLGQAGGRYVFADGGISREVFNHIRSIMGDDGKILELGSGPVSTRYLSEFYHVISIEEDWGFVNREHANYTHAPIVNEWYDTVMVRGCLAVHGNYRLILVDGPKNPMQWMGMIAHADIFNLSVPIVINNTSHEVAERLAIMLGQKTGRAVQWVSNFAVV